MYERISSVKTTVWPAQILCTCIYISYLQCTEAVHHCGQFFSSSSLLSSCWRTTTEIRS